MRRKFYLLYGLLAVIFVVYAALSLFYTENENRSLVLNTVYLVPPFLAFLTGLYAVYQYGLPNYHARSMGFMVAGIGFWLIAETVWVVFVLKGIDPFPSIADFFYVIGYPFLGYGLFREYRESGISLSKRQKSWLAVFIAVMCGIIGYFGIYGAVNMEESLFVNLVAMSYGVMDLVLVFIVSLCCFVASQYQSGRFFKPWVYFLCGVGLMLLTDVLFAIFSESYFSGVWLAEQLDIGYVLAYLFFSFAFLRIAQIIIHFQMKVSERATERVL